MRIVALRAVGCAKGLSLVSLDECGILDVVAVNAERGDGFGQMKVKFMRRFSPILWVAWQVSHPESRAA